LYKKWIVLGFIGILLIGGGFVVKGMQYDTLALKDSFTRDFIIQDEQAPEGFHVFESKIGTYTMLFPSDFQLESPEAYGRQGSFFEIWNSYSEVEENNIRKIKGTFQEVEEGQIEAHLETLKSENGVKKYYDLYENGNIIIFLEKSVKTYDSKKREMVLGDPEKETANTYFGFVANKNTNQTLELDYIIACSGACSINEEKELDFIKTLVDSVEFKSSAKE